MSPLIGVTKSSHIDSMLRRVLVERGVGTVEFRGEVSSGIGVMVGTGADVDVIVGRGKAGDMGAQAQHNTPPPNTITIMRHISLSSLLLKYGLELRYGAALKGQEPEQLWQLSFKLQLLYTQP